MSVAVTKQAPSIAATSESILTPVPIPICGLLRVGRRQEAVEAGPDQRGGDKLPQTTQTQAANLRPRVQHLGSSRASVGAQVSFAADYAGRLDCLRE
jgi:hypothetical protein